MQFKTLILKIYKPTLTKKTILDTTMKNYTMALEWLLKTKADEIDKLSQRNFNPKKGEIIALIDKNSSDELNKFDVQPFKDSLKMEFTSIVMSYIAQKSRRKASFPNLYLNDTEYNEHIQNMIMEYTFGKCNSNELKKKSNQIIEHYDRTHLLYFGRYSTTRDYCLLYDDLKKRYYVKLYLLNNKNSLATKADTGIKELKYIVPGMKELKDSKVKRRYLIMPLAFGEYQRKQLDEALINPSILHTAKVIKKNDEYYLYLNIESKQKQLINVTTTMGLARTEYGLHYTIPKHESGRIKIKHKDFIIDSNIYNVASKIIKKAQKHNSQVIVESNGGKNDQLNNNSKLIPLSTTDYSKLTKVLSYKLPEVGLPKPIEVSANKLYSTCPVCGCKSNKNRLSEHIFACSECGYAGLIEDIGSRGLALRLEKYKEDKLPIYLKLENGVKVYYNNTIQFKFCDDSNSDDLSRMFYELSLYCKGNVDFINNSKKYCMLKKLKDSKNIRDAIRIVM